MTHRTGGRILRVKALARVEGEGALKVTIRGDEVVQAELTIYEPPRFFEAFLRGRSYEEPPDITARICGICPVAYQMSACRAIEDACGVKVEGQIADLRRLLYCGEWIESHALHIYLLHAPDFLGVSSAIDLAVTHREIVEQALRLKKLGNSILEIVGGRAIHPINVKVGGFHQAPNADELRALIPELDWARQCSLETVRLVSTFNFPELEGEWDLIALLGTDKYPIIGDRIASVSGRLDIPISEFRDHITEEHVEHSNALHGHWDLGEYAVGPLARYSLNYDLLPQVARDAAAEVGLGPDCRNPFKSIIVRAVELLAACDEAQRLINEYVTPEQPFVEVTPRAGVGHGMSEAPRGLLYHRYELDDEGIVQSATIVPPTAQNQPAIEHDLLHVVQDNLDLGDADLTGLCEQTIRNYDPCISCATHFLDLQIDRD
ncbi:MAG: Ni/Fe hydrogenase subunit alpha [Candidatus Nanopelagicales bacterium]|nr:Ni/Fe hydrogenase subunit alpha [Candidatus Nanopelagicales bacterium]MDZ4248626.1 Ni/Fe hydrogenase subunit alpha [Candidatus Nanopelagicales bacterium]